MDILIKIFGEGRNLDALQMSCRGIVVFFISLIFIRISGRRSFGLRAPLDNIIAILLGAVLSRAIVGASAFVPVIICCFMIVLLHRGFSWLIVKHEKFAKLVEGNKILLYEDGQIKRHNLKKALVCEQDMMQGVRKSAMVDDLSQVDKIYMERNGEVSVILKDRK